MIANPPLYEVLAVYDGLLLQAALRGKLIEVVLILVTVTFVLMGMRYRLKEPGEGGDKS